MPADGQSGALAPSTPICMFRHPQRVEESTFDFGW